MREPVANGYLIIGHAPKQRERFHCLAVNLVNGAQYHLVKFFVGFLHNHKTNHHGADLIDKFFDDFPLSPPELNKRQESNPCRPVRLFQGGDHIPENVLCSVIFLRGKRIHPGQDFFQPCDILLRQRHPDRGAYLSPQKRERLHPLILRSVSHHIQDKIHLLTHRVTCIKTFPHDYIRAAVTGQ